MNAHAPVEDLLEFARGVGPAGHGEAASRHIVDPGAVGGPPRNAFEVTPRPAALG